MSNRGPQDLSLGPLEARAGSGRRFQAQESGRPIEQDQLGGANSFKTAAGTLTKSGLSPVKLPGGFAPQPPVGALSTLRLDADPRYDAPHRHSLPGGPILQQPQPSPAARRPHVVSPRAAKNAMELGSPGPSHPGRGQPFFELDSPSPVPVLDPLGARRHALDPRPRYSDTGTVSDRFSRTLLKPMNDDSRLRDGGAPQLSSSGKFDSMNWRAGGLQRLDEAFGRASYDGSTSSRMMGSLPGGDRPSRSSVVPAFKERLPNLTDLESIVGCMFEPVSSDLLKTVEAGAGGPKSISRKSLLLKVPVVGDAMSLDLPAAVVDKLGNYCLIILPSDKPSARAEAVALEGLLAEVLKEPRQAVQKATAWRAQTLQTLCFDGVNALTEGLYGTYTGSKSWMVKADGGVRQDVKKSPSLGNGQGDTDLSTLPGVTLMQEERPSQDVASRRPHKLEHTSDTATRSVGRPDAHKPAHGPSRLQQQLLVDDDNVQAALSLAVAATICMADVVRQVEVHCGERGRVLTHIWNAYLHTHEHVMHDLRKTNQELQELSDRVVAENKALTDKSTSMEYLRKEISRFRREAETASDESSAMLRENLYWKEMAEESKAALAELDACITRKLAILRWQHAFHVLGTRSQQVVLVSGGLGPAGDRSALISKVFMVDALRSAVVHAQRRKQTFGIARRAEEYEYGATFSEVVKLALHERHQTKWAAGDIHEDPEAVLKSLPSLQPDGQVLVLTTLPEATRRKVLQLMDPVHRAQLLVLMSNHLREQTRQAIGDAAWAETMTIIQTNPALAARMLHVMDLKDALLEFCNWATRKQIEVLAAMIAANDSETAAKLLYNAPSNLRKDLITKMPPQLAADCFKHMEPLAHVITCVNGLSAPVQISILSCMSPQRAAAIMLSYGVDAAAKIFMGMANEEVRNAIISQMRPKFAAAALIAMDNLLAEQQAYRRTGGEQPDSPAVPAVPGEQQAGGDAAAASTITAAAGADPEEGVSKVSGDALLNMPQNVAGLILGHLGFKEKANILSSMDPSAVSGMIALMEPGEALAMLAAMQDSSMHMVVQELTQHERHKLMQALGAADVAAARSITPEHTSLVSKTTTKGQRATIKMDEARKVEINQAYNTVLDKLIVGDDDNDDDVDDQEEEEEEEDSDADSDDDSDISSDDSSCDSDTYAHVPRAAVVGKGRPKTAKKAAKGSGLDKAAHRLQLHQSVAASSSSHRPSSGNVSPASPRRLTNQDSKKGGTVTAKEVGNRARLNIATRPASDSGGTGDQAVLEEAGHDYDAAPATPSTPTVASPQPRHKNERAVQQAARQAPNRSRAALGVAVVKDEHVSEDAGAADDGMADDAVRPAAPEVEGLDEQQEEEEEELEVAATADGKPLSSPKGKPAGSPKKGVKSTGRAALLGAPPPPAAHEDKPGDIAPDKQKMVLRAVRVGLKNTAEGQAVIKAAKGRLAAAEDMDEAWDALQQAAKGGMGAAAAVDPQAKLGKLPKNQRLKDAMNQFPNAKPKPKGWLLAVVEQVYKDADTMIKKLGRLEAHRKLSVPEVVFVYFFNKFGQKKIVSENVGSLVNTLSLYTATDIRFEAFAKFLCEEWDFTCFMDFLQAQHILQQPIKMVCLEYPKDAAKDEPYPWACLYKSLYTCDVVFGPRSKTVRDAFTDILKLAAVQVDDSEVDKARKDKRFEGEALPSAFYKLHRPRFFNLLCKELQRINTFITRLAEEKFSRLDVQRTDQIPTSSLPSYLKEMLPPSFTSQQVQDVQRAFVQFAEAMNKDIPLADVVVEEVKAVSRDMFILATVQHPAIRDHIKGAVLPPPKLDDNTDEAEMFKVYLSSVVLRHMAVMLPHYRTWLAVDRADVLVRDQMLAVGKEPAGDAKFKAYLNMLAAFVNVKISAFIENVMASVEGDGLDHTAIEELLAKIEDMAVVLLSKDARYQLLCPEQVQAARTKRLPHGLRLAHESATYKARPELHHTQRLAAVRVIQSVWRARQQQRRALLLQQQRA